MYLRKICYTMPNAYDMHEMSAWMKMVSSPAVDKTGSKCHAWVCLTVQGKGRKLRPLIVFKGANQHVQMLNKEFYGKRVVSSSESQFGIYTVDRKSPW